MTRLLVPARREVFGAACLTALRSEDSASRLTRFVDGQHMSRKWAFSLIAITFLSIGTLAGALILPRTVEAAKEPAKMAPPRIAYVNVAKVLRMYEKANEDGQKITKKRQEFIDGAKDLNEELARLKIEIQNNND